MDNMLLVDYLRKVIPNINITDKNIQELIGSEIPYDDKVKRILLFHFDQTRCRFETLSTEAKAIKRLVPWVKLSFIEKQLEIFRDMHNRKEIVLRNIVYSPLTDSMTDLTFDRQAALVQPNTDYCKAYVINAIVTGVKRNTPIQLAESTNSCIPQNKIRKVRPSSTVIKLKEWPVNDKPVDVNPSILGESVTNLRKISAEELNTEGQHENVLVSDVPVTDGMATVAPDKEMFLFDQNKNAIVEGAITPLDMPLLNEIELPFADNNTDSSIKSSVFSDQTPASFEELCEHDYLNEIKQEQKDNTRVSEEPILEGSEMTVAQFYTVDNINKETQHDQNFCSADLPQLEYYSHNDSNLVSSTIVPEHDDRFLSKSYHDLGAEARGETLLQNDVEQANVNMSPKTNSSGCQECPINEVVSRNNNTTDNLFTYMPSTSKEQEVHHAPVQFDLVEYIHDITNAPINFIQEQCRKLNVPTWTRPSPPILSTLIDNILTNKISSESSDGEDDVQEVDVICNNQLFSRPVIRAANKLNSSVPAMATPMMAPAQVMAAAQSVPDTNQNESSVKLIENNVSNAPNTFVDNHLVNYLCGIFPDASREYITGLCKNKSMNDEVLDQITTEILNSNGQYPKRPPVIVEPDTVPENQFEILKEFLPDADPDYLRMMCDRYEGKADKIKDFINEAMERRDYPKLKDYQRRQQLSAQQKQYTTEFNVENFIKVIPEPLVFFADPTRIIKMDNLSSHYALTFLRNTFSRLPVRTIQATFAKNNCKLFQTFQELKGFTRESKLWMRSTRKPVEMPKNIQNIPLLQEIAYITHEVEINKYLEERKNKQKKEREEALRHGLMKTCSCCYDEEVLPRDLFTCENGCEFCKDCIVKSTEVRFGEGKLDFPCLMDCSSQFSLQTLQAVLSPKLFSKIAQKKALDEVKSAGIEELETCPFCDFATIPAEGYNIFSCLNPECMKESCRLCKEPSHIPLRCDEIEKDEEVKARTYVENKMTEALLRKCWKCGVKFFKEDGCNKMTCSCGAHMCYICGSPVKDYKHFNGNGGDRYDLCPLYSDTKLLNKENVLRGATEAKTEIGVQNLKNDPTKDIHQHFQERSSKFTPHEIILQQNQARMAVIEALGQLGQRRRDRHHF